MLPDGAELSDGSPTLFTDGGLGCGATSPTVVNWPSHRLECLHGALECSCPAPGRGMLSDNSVAKRGPPHPGGTAVPDGVVGLLFMACQVEDLWCMQMRVSSHLWAACMQARE